MVFGTRKKTKSDNRYTFPEKCARRKNGEIKNDSFLESFVEIEGIDGYETKVEDVPMQ